MQAVEREFWVVHHGPPPPSSLWKLTPYDTSGLSYGLSAACKVGLAAVSREAWSAPCRRPGFPMPYLAVATFAFSVLLTLGAAGFFADRLDHLAPRLGMPEALVGLLTALAADAPEISSALIALAKGAKSVSLGVVLGSNAFNLAAMIGLSAVVAGSVRIEPRSLAVEGAVGLLGALLAAGVIVGAIVPGLALLAFAAVLVPYLILLARRAPAPRSPMSALRTDSARRRAGAWPRRSSSPSH